MDSIVDFVFNLIPAKFSGLAVALAGLVAGVGGFFAAKSKNTLDDKAVEVAEKLSKKEPKKDE